jgi:heme a synthase
MTSLRARIRVTPDVYAYFAYAALGLLTLIVFTGAAVRLTGSGLGCPTWPKCTATSLYAPLESHRGIEFGNRLLTGLVGLPCFLAWAGAYFRRPYRRDFLWLGLGLCLTILFQAVLGGITVRTGLNPWTVMAHYLVSMLSLALACTLAWRAHYARRRETPVDVGASRRFTYALRAVVVFGFVVLIAGSAATAAGPHAGGEGTGDEVARFTFMGSDTLDWLIHRHGALAAVLGVAIVVLWTWSRRERISGHLGVRLTGVAVLLALQGVVGIAQYELELPAEIVWVHVVLAALTWDGLCLAWLDAGKLRQVVPPAPEELAGAPVAPSRASVPA